MGEAHIPKGPSKTAVLIGSSGCSDIQNAIKTMAKQGMGVDDLDPKTVDTVIETMASAKSAGAHAAPVIDSSPSHEPSVTSDKPTSFLQFTMEMEQSMLTDTQEDMNKPAFIPLVVEKAVSFELTRSYKPSLLQKPDIDAGVESALSGGNPSLKIFPDGINIAIEELTQLEQKALEDAGTKSRLDDLRNKGQKYLDDFKNGRL